MIDYAAKMLRDDLLFVLDAVTRARIAIAEGSPRDAEIILRISVAEKLARVIASPDVPALADLVDGMRAAERESIA